MRTGFVSLPLARIALLGVVPAVVAIPIALGLGKPAKVAPEAAKPRQSAFQRHETVDTSGFGLASTSIRPWRPDASLETVARAWKNVTPDQLRQLETALRQHSPDDVERVPLLTIKAISLNYAGKPEAAYKALCESRKLLEQHPDVAAAKLYTTIYYQGITALRMGETENCVRCRGASACIIPFDRAATHRKQRGSRLAVQHFLEYLKEFPDEMDVRWLLNLAQMTLGEYPEKVDPRYYVPLDHFAKSEFDIGVFHDIGYKIGLDRTNQAGGVIMDDFDNDGRLDIVVSSFDATQQLAYYHNTGNGSFQDVALSSGLAGQLGGLNCVQADYNNDGYLDIFITRGAWLQLPIRPSLLRNNGDGTFTDVTKEAGVQEAVNSNSAAWADYDNDGYVDLFVCCEQQPNRLYHNLGNGKLKEVAGPAGLLDPIEHFCKGATWSDYDNDGYPDLFVNYMDGTAHLFHNERNGRFEDTGASMGINGPTQGFSCWSFDYDNDGWTDIFATCYQRSVPEVVNGLMGKPTTMPTSRLFHNLQGKGFADMTKQAGLDMVFSTMGSNFADFDNDGFLDMYLATGEPNLGALFPNRMFKNVAGQRFSEITGTSRTGQLQKGHGVACGDWDRDGNVDLFVDLGGAVPGDAYHNVMFQNPGHTNQWLTLKLVGKKTNRAAIGARIKVVTGGKLPQTIHRTVCSGSSFGGNPLQQTIGLGQADHVETVEVYWPTSRTTQVFHNISVNQALEITELAAAPRPLHWTKLPVPAPDAGMGMMSASVSHR